MEDLLLASLPEASLKVKDQIVNQTLSKIFLACLSALCLSLSFSFSATAQSQDIDIRPFANQLDKERIQSAFSNVTMDGAYNFGRNGKAQSFYVEHHTPEGIVSYEEDGIVEPGRWFVRQNTICYMYPADSMTGGCFRVYQVKNCYYFYTTSRRQVPGENGQPYWTARAVKQGERAGCEKAVS